MSVEQYTQVGSTLMQLLTLAWLLPLAGFCVEIFGGSWADRKSRVPAYVAVGCIGAGFVCSLIALLTWMDAANFSIMPIAADHEEHASEGAHHDDAHASVSHGDAAHAAEDHAHPPAASTDAAHAAHAATLPAAEGTGAATGEHAHEVHGNDPYKVAFSGTYYTLARIGSLNVSLDWYIDGLTVLMFAMVTLIATCIHVFAIGYMSDELTEHYEDHQVHLPGGRHFHRPGRFYRFFAYLSLFSFSMLGLVLAGNIFQVFIFWELVGVCSYLLIGFYVERHSASTAANKAFIMNRVGDFGFLIGLMILWTWFGTFQFAQTNPEIVGERGLFQMVRDSHGHMDVEGSGTEKVVYLLAGDNARASTQQGVVKFIPYWLLVTAGLGIFAGCIGKSAQFPLQTWLPDAMEGPTPVSALVHSATMVAAGVYLTGRFYPMFTPEVLLTIAYVGCITLFVGATIAIVATDIKKVLAYSTISQLGYMMLGLGVGGWMAGLFHLITHAFFKSLMFLCSGSVIHGCHHEQEMTKMGGLYKKMPITCWTMFVGVVAIAGLAIPGLWLPVIGPVALSGYHSKDAIVASALTFADLNPKHSVLFFVPLLTAGITSFYMFRMWFMTFFGKPRDHHVYDHAHESPNVMTTPLLVLSVFAAFCAFGGEAGPLARLILSSEGAHVAAGVIGEAAVTLPSHHQIHDHHAQAGAMALLAAFVGMAISYVIYCRQAVDPAAISANLAPAHRFLANKWGFDDLYDLMWVRPVHVVATWCTGFDKYILDGFLHLLSRMTVIASSWDRKFDEAVIDRVVNVLGQVTFSAGRSLRVVQTGSLRQYVMFIAVGVVSLFVIMFAFLPR